MRSILILLSLAASAATSADATAGGIGPKKALRATVKTAHAIKAAKDCRRGPVVVRRPACGRPVVVATPRPVHRGPLQPARPVCATPVRSCGTVSDGFHVDVCAPGHDHGLVQTDAGWRIRVVIRHRRCGYRGTYWVHRRGATRLSCGGCGHRFVYRRCY